MPPGLLIRSAYLLPDSVAERIRPVPPRRTTGHIQTDSQPSGGEALKHLTPSTYASTSSLSTARSQALGCRTEKLPGDAFSRVRSSSDQPPCTPGSGCFGDHEGFRRSFRALTRLMDSMTWHTSEAGRPTRCLGHPSGGCFPAAPGIRRRNLPTPGRSPARSPGGTAVSADGPRSSACLTGPAEHGRRALS